MPKLSPNNITRTTIKNENGINFNSYRGVINGNIFPKTPISGCEIKLDFSCEDNSQYIPVV